MDSDQLSAFELDEAGVDVLLEGETSKKTPGSPGEQWGGGGRGTLNRLLVQSRGRSQRSLLHVCGVDEWGVETELHTGFLGAAEGFALLLLSDVCVFDRLPPFIKVKLLTS